MINGPRRPAPRSTTAPASRTTSANSGANATRSSTVAKKFNDAWSTGAGRALRTKALGLNAPPPRPLDVSASAKGGVTVKPSDGGITLTANGEFTTELKNKKGYGVSFGISAEASVVTNQETKDGVTTFSVSTDASVSVSGGVSTPQVGVTVGHTEGIKASYEVSMPEAAAKGVNPATVNPFDPSSMPTGTTITMDGSHYSTNEFGATFKNLAIATKITNEQGVSVAIEKTGANTVRVTAGPTEAIEAYNGVGVDFGVASAMIGRNDRLSTATLKTAEFDLSTPEGKAAYNDFLTTGTLPADNGPGISNVATIEKLDFESQTRLDAKLGPIEISLGGSANVQSRVVTTLPDGSKSVSIDFKYGGHTPLNVAIKFDKNGNEIVSERRYTYAIKATDYNADLLNAALTGDMASGTIKPGQTVTLEFTQEQMIEYMHMTERAVTEGGEKRLGEFVMDPRDNLVGSPEHFAWTLAQRYGSDDNAQAERMFDIADAADGVPDGNYTAIPATYTVS